MTEESTQEHGSWKKGMLSPFHRWWNRGKIKQPSAPAEWNQFLLSHMQFVAPLKALINHILATSSDSAEYFPPRRRRMLTWVVTGRLGSFNFFFPEVIWWEPREFYVPCDSYIEFPEMQGSSLKHRGEWDNVETNLSASSRRPALLFCDAGETKGKKSPGFHRNATHQDFPPPLFMGEAFHKPEFHNPATNTMGTGWPFVLGVILCLVPLDTSSILLHQDASKHCQMSHGRNSQPPNYWSR